MIGLRGFVGCFGFCGGRGGWAFSNNSSDADFPLRSAKKGPKGIQITYLVTNLRV